MHSGNRVSGHAYSYCWDEEGRWYTFNDESVLDTSWEEFKEEAFGIGSTNAYILVYEKQE